MKKLLRNRINYVTASLTIIAVIAVGTLIIRFSSAASPFAFEAETGSISGLAAVVSDSAASAGKALVFGSGATPTPGASATPSPGGGLTFAQVKAMVDAQVANNTGKNTDINREPGFSRPGAAALRAVCGAGWISIYPMLAWEYGGTDHLWVNGAASPLLICVKLPDRPPYGPDWVYANGNVTATVYVKFPENSPCGAKLADCMNANQDNYEILGDEASGGATDGGSVGLDLTEASTTLNVRIGETLQLLVNIP